MKKYYVRGVATTKPAGNKTGEEISVTAIVGARGKIHFIEANESRTWDNGEYIEAGDIFKKNEWEDFFPDEAEKQENKIPASILKKLK